MTLTLAHAFNCLWYTVNESNRNQQYAHAPSCPRRNHINRHKSYMHAKNSGTPPLPGTRSLLGEGNRAHCTCPVDQSKSSAIHNHADLGHARLAVIVHRRVLGGRRWRRRHGVDRYGRCGPRILQLVLIVKVPRWITDGLNNSFARAAILIRTISGVYRP